MKSLVISLAKKYVISAINDLLSKNADNTKKICETINLWIERLTSINAQLKKVSERCADGQLDSEEVDQSIEEIQTLIKEFK